MGQAAPAAAQPGAPRSGDRSLRYHPFARLASDVGDEVVVGVVVDHHEAVPVGGRGDEQIRELHAAKLATLGEDRLHFEGAVPSSGIGKTHGARQDLTRNGGPIDRGLDEAAADTTP